MLQRKSFNVLLLNAYDNLLQPGAIHEVELDLFCSVLGYNSKNYTYLKESLQKLQTITVEGDLFDDDGECEEWGSFVLLSEIKINYKKRKIFYGFPTSLAKELYNPSIFANLNLSIQGSFNSKYALALYENCVRYMGIGQTGEIDVEILKKLLGVSSKTYDQFKAFNQKVISPAVKEVNKISDINITKVVTIKEGRNIKRVKFLFESKKQRNLLTSASQKDNIEQSKIYIELLSLGMDQKWALLTCVSHEESYLREKIEYANRKEIKGEVTNYKGFLYKAIKNDWKDEKQEKLRITQEKKKVENTARDVQKEEKAQEKIKAEGNKELAESYLENLNDLEFNQLIEEFFKSSMGAVWKKYKGDYKKYIAILRAYILSEKIN
ncbi:MAG: RepB family plasmid replication initiator protein [Alteromonadaceae bacterium]|nr:RepB family plasmid replication initiator protein [Alteromonadaceae bacterium]